MKLLKIVALVAVAGSLSACEVAMGDYGYESHKKDKTVDRGFDSKHLSQLEAGIWIDPQGCDHWIIDDGVEGYLSARVDKYGKPVCSGVGAPSTALGPYKSGSVFPDPI
ncbi:hypothetical protein AQS8620_02647 [Aquimixticola soesokkakensis]|uniref:Lipoprotein n=1 Tax=Aquimixticola soesokkakensis TaxID=1519096 RepID=A0A1Y5TAU5_9RHOB|nr:hypothetical protein [Aquimixticola soesokkakensis]SLN59380.1 hypothetical protein AQS8620_02647 [Aquimixticola soesokkakensis]